jgi:hypothetical protein
MDKPLWVHTDGETEFMAKDIRLQVLDERLRMIV